ncbi:MAG: helix-turn-helix transcriptional regulator [Conexibacter sp.]
MPHRPRSTPTTDKFLHGLAAVTRVIRARERLTQTAVAERSGLSPHLVSRIENGRADPRVTEMDRLAKALGLGGVRELHLAVDEANVRLRSS